MTEIEKLFENANAYKMLCNCEFKNLFDYSIAYGQDVCFHAEDEIMKGCGWCELAEQNVKYYPPFTAEKQLELIKFLAKRDYGDYTSSLLINITDDRVYFSAAAKPTYYAVEVLYDSNRCIDFDNALANLINHLWQDLTDQEKEEIRRILNE